PRISLDPLDRIIDSFLVLRALPVHPPTPCTNWRNLLTPTGERNLLTPHADLPTSASMVCSLIPGLNIITKNELIPEA
ncbi:hypothetical protein CHARACLAT_031738, partial [Characodon lateralis]|nr:hypothetical protein [Characodon lateralis]